jgi:heme exporter protein D
MDITNGMASQTRLIIPSTRWQALIGTLPFLAFGFSRMVWEVDDLFSIRGHDVEMVVYGLCLVGLLIGWIRYFPVWSYSYLGWSFLLAYFNTNWGFYGDPDFQVWIPFGITVLIAILWTHSFAPIKKLFQDIWNDWTRLSLAMFAFGGFVWMIYDENHHPQLLWFILAATLAISAGAWFFLRGESVKNRVLSIIGGFFAADIISQICYATWDYRAYYGLPESTRTWQESLGINLEIRLFWLGILFWPAVIGLLHRIASKYVTITSGGLDSSG